MKRFLSTLAGAWATVALGLVYFAVLGPACAVARALGWDPLELDEGAQATYWRSREDEPGCSERTY